MGDQYDARIKIPDFLDTSGIDCSTERMQKALKALNYRQVNICDECRRPYDEEDFVEDPECAQALESLTMKELMALKEYDMKLQISKISGVNPELLS